jgi:hypothetical protein
MGMGEGARAKRRANPLVHGQVHWNEQWSDLDGKSIN